MSSKQVPPKIHSSVLQTVPLRKEDDILYQWRLRRKVESAKRGTQFMIAEKEYESQGKGRSLKQDDSEQKFEEAVSENSKVTSFRDNYKVRKMHPCS